MDAQKNGLETLKEIRENPEYNDNPVLVVTSKSEEKTTAYKLGADDFISKPYNPEELKLRVFNHLRVKKLYRYHENYQTSLRLFRYSKLPKRGSRYYR